MTTSESEHPELCEELRRGLDSREGEVELARLLQRAEKLGASSRAAWETVCEICADRSVQLPWAHWETVESRAEITLRLQVLAEVDRIDSALESFLTFFFRASAPDLYRPAAVALGRHSWGEQTFERDLREYASTRSLSLEGPVPLNGERSRRRLLLAATSRFVHAPDERKQLETPLLFDDSELFDDRESFDDPESADATSVADASVRAVSASMLLASGVEEPSFLTGCWRIAQNLHPVLGRGGSQRSYVRAWGELLEQLHGRDAPRAARVFSEQLRAFDRRDEREFSGYLASFWELDAALEIAAKPEFEVVEHLEVGDVGELFDDIDLRWLARARVWQWGRRHSDGSLEVEPAEFSVPDRVEPHLAALLRRVICPVAAGESYPDKMHRWVARAIRTATRPEQWWSFPEQSRALLSFLLLDAIRFRPPPRAAIRRLLTVSGVSRFDAASLDTSAVPGVTGMPWEGFHDLLWQIYQVEGAPANFPVESEAFTSMASADRLLGFVRAARPIRDLDLVVDALEHFLRLELASDPDFEFRTFLYRIATRKPHPSLFRALAKRTRGRDYETVAGDPVAVTASLEMLAEERSRDSDAPPSEDAARSWFPELARIRRSLLEIESMGDLSEALDAFADQLDPRIPEPHTKYRGLLDLLGRASTTKGEVLLDSSTSEATVSLEQLTSQIGESIRQMREAAQTLFAAESTDLSSMYRAGRNVVRYLRSIRDRIEPSVSRRDAAILERVSTHLVDRFAEWVQTLERDLETALPEESHRDPEVIEDVFARIRRAVAKVDHPPMQSRLFRIGYAQLAARGRSGSRGDTSVAVTDEYHDWEFEKELLRRGTAETADLELDERWFEFLTDRWELLTSTAMQVQYEPGVRELAESRNFARLRHEARESSTMEQLEEWLMDRYLLGTLTQLLGEQQSVDGTWLPAGPRAAGRMLVNFTHVWLALLVGAVMLLDFGDAWVELARQGDVAGIVTTFGIGIGGTFLYLLADIAQKTQSTFEDDASRRGVGPWLRATAFLAVCFGYTVLVTGGLWYMFSGTDLVLHGGGARLHVLVWTGFALFVGVFFGLLTESA